MNRKNDILNQIGIIIFCIFLFWIVTQSGVLFGSKTDWLSQHTIFPEYLRNLFYETGELFPNFAPHIGAGQNIYALSYYGLLNPIVMISYLFPSVSMLNYLVTSSYILFILTGLLFYHFLRSHKVESNISLLSTILLLCSSCLLFHFHRHFMFVNYMPFLILGLIGIDHYFHTKKKWLYLISTFIMIMMSYYYSVTGIFVFVIYGIYQYIKMNENITFQKFIKDGFCFVMPIFIAILMAGILLLPTIHMILSGRTSETVSITIWEILLPNLNLDGILYDTYCLGFTSIVLFSLMELWYSKKREQKWLAIALTCVLILPIFAYLLNGTLYIRDKILIPFLPLFGMVVAEFFIRLKEKTIHYKEIIFGIGIITILAFFQNGQSLFFYLDIGLMVVLILIYIKLDYKKIGMLLLLVVVFTNFIQANQLESYVTEEEYHTFFSEDRQLLIDDVLSKEKDMVRSNQLDDPLYTINKVYRNNYYQTSIYSSTYNANYRKFYADVFGHQIAHRNSLITSQGNNILYQMLMGVKYITTSRKAPVGYRKLKEVEEGPAIYQNKNVLPIGYVSYDTISEKAFDQIPFPYKNEVLLNQTVTKNSTKKEYLTHIKKIFPNTMTKYLEQDIEISKTKKGYKIKALDTSVMQLKLDHSLKNKILMISFDVKNQPTCEEGDFRITINQVKNKLTCEDWIYQNNNHKFQYVISSSKATSTLTIGFAKGEYEIENIEVYELDYNDIKDVKQKKDEWRLDTKKSTANTLTGNVTAKEDGYFTTSIPYDDGFHVYVDGQETKYEMVNKGFVGFPIKKGNHLVTLKYQTPWFQEGTFLSITGFLIAIIMILYDFKKRK